SILKELGKNSCNSLLFGAFNDTLRECFKDVLNSQGYIVLEEEVKDFGFEFQNYNLNPVKYFLPEKYQKSIDYFDGGLIYAIDSLIEPVDLVFFDEMGQTQILIQPKLFTLTYDLFCLTGVLKPFVFFKKDNLKELARIKDEI
ncbi:hypothetical protein O8I61_08305, partial [Campylobacter lari]|uniref:hypothetical protein n=1 Tax=Campylobacter lari TaxID=201 RepID=UPI0037288AB8